MKPGTSWGLIPENVSVMERAKVTAGFANDVDDVNQYAPVMYVPTANGTTEERNRTHPQITANNPNVATNSLNIWTGPERTCRDAAKIGSSNMRSAVATPANAPTIWAVMYAGTCRHPIPRCHASAKVTAGLKCAPEMGPNVRIRATSIAPVARVLASRAMATLPPDKRSPMIPEPTTAASKSAVPTASDTTRLAKLIRLSATRRSATRSGGGFLSADECAHEFAVYLRRNGVNVNALTAQKRTSVLDSVNSRGFDIDVLESC